MTSMRLPRCSKPTWSRENWAASPKKASTSIELKATAFSAEKNRAVDTRLEVTLRLLLVDDDPGLRALLRATLDAVDVEMEDAEDAPNALTAVRERRPDAIVLDV